MIVPMAVPSFRRLPVQLIRPVLAILFALAALPSALRAADKPAPEAKPAYPLDTCVVSGQKLGAHGEPYVFQYKGRELRFCCKPCKKDFLKNPAEYLRKLDEAAAKPAEPAPAPQPGK